MEIQHNTTQQKTHALFCLPTFGCVLTTHHKLVIALTTSLEKALRHLTSDEQQSGRAWNNQRGKKTVLSLTPIPLFELETACVRGCVVFVRDSARRSSRPDALPGETADNNAAHQRKRDGMGTRASETR